MFCSKCHSDLKINHLLEDTAVPPMKNNSKVIHPKCSNCGYPIQISDVAEYTMADRRVILISGTAGSGKTAIGQYLESLCGYVFIDGDAISKRVNYYARMDSSIKVEGHSCQIVTIRTMLIVLALGYHVVVGYVINQENLERYVDALAKYGIIPIFRVLVPDRSVCIERDIGRACWTAGEGWIDKWYEEQRSYLATHASCCIDSSNESLEETIEKHFALLL